ncbi:MAG: hypothetical protein R3Y68_00410 [Rikenellaceae bacterium]
MKKTAKKLLLTLALLLLTLGSTTAMMVVMTKVSKQIKVIGIDRIELKGMSAIQIVVEIDNGSNYDLTMSEASADIMHDGRKIGQLEQVEPITAYAMKRESVKSLWRLKEVDPVTLLLLSGKILQNDFSDLRMNYRSVIQAGKYSHDFVDEDVDISKFLAIFSSEKEQTK